MIRPMPPLSEHERIKVATEEAQRRMREGLGPPPATPEFPPVIRFEFDVERSKDALLCCHNCGATTLRPIKVFHDNDGQVGTLALCDGCNRPFGVIVAAVEDEQGSFLTVAIRPIAGGSGLRQSRER